MSSRPNSAITVRFYAGAAEAAGAEELQLPLAEAQSLDGFLAELSSLIPAGAGAEQPASSAPSLEHVCLRSSFLINGVRAKRNSGSLSPGDQLDILPPFAGG